MNIIRPSSLKRYKHCPAACWREKDLPDLPDNGAAAGTETHAWIAAHFQQAEPPAISSDQEETGERCIQAYYDYAEQFGTADAWIVEQEFELSLREGWILRGHPDFVAVHGQDEVIPDWKTLYGEYDPPENNLQLGSYALLRAACYTDTQRFHLGLIQPCVRDGIRWAVFERAELVRFWNEIQSIVDAIIEAGENGTAPVTGNHCQYCRDVLCPSRQQNALQAARYDIDPARWADTAPEIRLEAYNIACNAKRTCEIMKGMIEADLARNPAEYGGELYLKPGKKITSLNDPAAFFRALSAETGLDGSDVTRCAKFRLGDNEEGPGLDRIVKERSGRTMKDAKELVRGLMAAHGTTKQGNPVLARKGEE